ncbi:hypothetical protein D3C85_1742150 [compost metagenome]
MHDAAAFLVAAGVVDRQLAAVGQRQRGAVAGLAAAQRVAQGVGQYQAIGVVPQYLGVQRALVGVEIELFGHGFPRCRVAVAAHERYGYE